MAYLIAALPPVGTPGMPARWEQAAQDSLLLLDEGEFQALRSTWVRYSARMAAVAENVQPYAASLHALAVPAGPDAAAAAATDNTSLGASALPQPTGAAVEVRAWRVAA